jgi:hypothetical protein
VFVGLIVKNIYQVIFCLQGGRYKTGHTRIGTSEPADKTGHFKSLPNLPFLEALLLCDTKNVF